MQNKKTIWKSLSLQSVLFVIFAVALIVLLYMRDINGVETNKFLLLGIVVAYALLTDYKHLMMLIAFILPLTNGLPGNYILPILCLLAVVKGRGQTKVPPLVWLSFILFSVYELMHVFMFASTFDVPAFVGYCSFLFLLFFIGGSNNPRSDDAMNALAFCLGSVVMLMIILMNFNQLVGDALLEGGVRLGNVTGYLDEDKMTLRTNPNNIGLFSISSISISFALWYYKKIPVWAFLLVAIPSFIGGVYSLSRTWMFSIILFVFLFFLLIRGRQRITSVLLLLIAALGIFYIFSSLDISFLDAFDNRFDTDTSTAGSRTTLFIAYHNWMIDNPWALLFGTGAIPYREVTQIFNSIHNALQQIYVAYGVPGLCYFAYLLICLIKRWHVQRERIIYLPILTIGFFLQSSQFLNPIYCAFPFIASFFVLKMLKKDEINQKFFKIS